MVRQGRDTKADDVDHDGKDACGLNGNGCDAIPKNSRQSPSMAKWGMPFAAVGMSKTGYEILINDSNVTQLQLDPEQLRLSFRGLDVPDDARLWDRGVRHDDAVVLEFESPAQPPILKILRAPAPPKKEKKGKGKKSK